jgi:hypothetical protein
MDTMQLPKLLDLESAKPSSIRLVASGSAALVLLSMYS